jgi:hypothetical protein
LGTAQEGLCIRTLLVEAVFVDPQAEVSKIIVAKQEI